MPPPPVVVQPKSDNLQGVIFSMVRVGQILVRFAGENGFRTAACRVFSPPGFGGRAAMTSRYVAQFSRTVRGFMLMS